MSKTFDKSLPNQKPETSKAISKLPPINNPEYYNLKFKYNGLGILLINYEFKNHRLEDFPADFYNPSLDIQSFKVLENFNYQTMIHKNLTKEQTKHLIHYFTTLFDFAEYASVFVCVTSHGDKKDIIYSSDEQEIDRNEDIIEPFYCVETLKHKPKLFLFDCCRGRKSSTTEAARMLIEKGTILLKNSVANNLAQRFDMEHFYFAFATVENFASSIYKVHQRSIFIWMFFEALNASARIEWDDLRRSIIRKMKANDFNQQTEFSTRSPYKFEFVKLEKSNTSTEATVDCRTQQAQRVELEQELENQRRQFQTQLDIQQQKFEHELTRKEEYFQKKLSEYKSQFQQQMQQERDNFDQKENESEKRFRMRLQAQKKQLEENFKQEIEKQKEQNTTNSRLQNSQFIVIVLLKI